MQKNNLTLINKFIFFAVIISVMMFFFGCDNTKEKVEDTSKTVEKTTEKAVEKVAEITDSVVTKTADNVENAAQKAEKVVEQKHLIGVWEGKLANRATTLTITSQDANEEITGKIVINLGHRIRQDVKGKYDPNSRTITMKDQLQQKDRGKYKGTISENGKVFTGTFTTLANNKSVDFKLVKK